MTPDDFRRIALSMPKAEEAYRLGRSEFRVERRTFAGLEGPADSVAILNLSPEQQSTFTHLAPRVFVPESGGWGKLGHATLVLEFAKEALVQSAMEAAWRNNAPRWLLRQLGEQADREEPG